MRFTGDEMTALGARSARSRAAVGTPHPRNVSYAAAIVDLTMLIVSGGLAVLGRERIGVFDHDLQVQATLDVAGPLVIAGWLIVIYLARGYQPEVFGVGTDEYKRVAHASLYTAALVGIGCYLTTFGLARGFFVILFALGVTLLLAGRLGLRRSLQFVRARGALRRRVLFVGSANQIADIAGVLRREPWLGWEIVGALVPPAELAEETASGVPVLGALRDVAIVVANHGIDVVFFAGGAQTSADDVRHTIWQLEAAPVQLVVAPAVSDISRERTRFRPVGGLPLVFVDPPTWTDASRLGKRLFDLFGSVLVMVLVAPVMLAVAARIRIHDGGPVLFRQRRVGRDGMVFDCLKFRTMVVDAEDRLSDLQVETGFTGGLFKHKTDPRITRPGHWLRRLSIDELPQLINVARGEMSLVGPRPPLPSEVSRYTEDTARRLRVRPGITGLWQVSGRADLSFAEAIRLDLYYFDNWSIVQDLTILMRTAGAVLSSRGAY